MANPVLHHNGRFVLWSTVVDAPLSEGMDRAEMFDMLTAQRGWQSDLALRAIDAAIVHGSSYRHGPGGAFYSLEDVISGNRAGPGEIEVAPQELIRLLFGPAE